MTKSAFTSDVTTHYINEKLQSIFIKIITGVKLTKSNSDINTEKSYANKELKQVRAAQFIHLSFTYNYSFIYSIF